MTTWFSRVKVFDRFGESIRQRKIELEGWKDNIKFAATAIGSYHRMSNDDAEKMTEQEFANLFDPAYEGYLEFIFAPEELKVAEDGMSATIDSEEYFSGVATTKELVLQRYAEAEAKAIDMDEWEEEEN